MVHCQSVLCVLLVVATAVGSLPVRLCACGIVRHPAIPSSTLAKASRPETIAAPVCCSHCTAHCCSLPAEAKTIAVEKPRHSFSCDCQSPNQPHNDSTPPQAPANSFILEFVSETPIPPAQLIAPTVSSSHTKPNFFDSPSVDLTTLLSRLTC
jgi:hypothetical protein